MALEFSERSAREYGKMGSDVTYFYVEREVLKRAVCAENAREALVSQVEKLFLFQQKLLT